MSKCNIDHINVNDTLLQALRHLVCGDPMSQQSRTSAGIVVITVIAERQAAALYSYLDCFKGR